MSQQTVTGLLQRWNDGDSEAFPELMEEVYSRLQRIARRQLASERHTIQATDVLHEALLGIMGVEDLTWQNRGHFYAIATRMMRRVLIDEVRRKGRGKRGGDLKRVPLQEARMVATYEGELDLVTLEAALEKLASWDERKARIVELRFFVGMTGEEIGHSLGHLQGNGDPGMAPGSYLALPRNPGGFPRWMRPADVSSTAYLSRFWSCQRRSGWPSWRCSVRIRACGGR